MQSESKNAKKPYHKPQIYVYGDVETFTLATQPVGMGDGAATGNAKTA